MTQRPDVGYKPVHSNVRIGATLQICAPQDGDSYHTNPSYALGGDPFLGEPEQINVPCYLSGGTDFGPFRSRNLTPDANGLPGD